MRTGFDVRLTPFSFEWFLDFLIDLYFITDIILNFDTGHYLGSIHIWGGVYRRLYTCRYGVLVVWP